MFTRFLGCIAPYINMIAFFSIFLSPALVSESCIELLPEDWRKWIDIVTFSFVFLVCMPMWFYITRHTPPRATDAAISNLPLLTYRRGMYSPDSSMCPICLNNYEPDDQLRVLPCSSNHHFHRDCIEQWLNTSATCPLCRDNLLGDQDVPIHDIASPLIGQAAV